MKYAPILAILLCVGGCGIFGGGSDSSSDSKPAAADPRAAERADLRNKISAKKQELAQTDADLAKIAAERDQKAGEAASESKTNRLIELARLEADTKQKKAAITDEISNLESQLNGGSGTSATAKPAKAGDALDDILASNDNKAKEDAERLKKKAEDDAAADKNRIAQADAAKKAEEEERAKQKIEGGRLAAGPDAPAFEDRWADVIQKVRGELQRFKRW